MYWYPLDLRSLALFRGLLGFTLLCDIALRARFLTAHYTDFGVLPRDVLIAQGMNKFQVCFHLVSGSEFWQCLIFLLQAVFASMLLVGYRTRLATLVSWLLLTSLHQRNPMIIQGGDVLLRLLLFWGFFLPLGSRASVDIASSKGVRDSPQVQCSMSTAALTLQLAFLYLFSGLIKLEIPEWQNGLGVYYALNDRVLNTTLGEWIGQHFETTRILSHLTLGMELLIGVSLCVPVKSGLLRTLTIFGAVAMHTSFSTCLKVGLFTQIVCTGLCALLPSSLWDRGLARFTRSKSPPLAIYYDGGCSVCKGIVALIQRVFFISKEWFASAQGNQELENEMSSKKSWVVTDGKGGRHYGFDAFIQVSRSSPWCRYLAWMIDWRLARLVGESLYRAFSANRGVISRLAPGQHSRSVFYGESRIEQLICGCCLLYVFIWNTGTLNHHVLHLPGQIHGFGYAMALDQKWSMFSRPIIDDGWFLIPGRLRNGHSTELMFTSEPTPVRWERPKSVSATFVADRWRKYLLNLRAPQNQSNLLHYGRYLCREWNERHADGETLEAFEIIYMKQDLNPDGTRALQPSPVIMWKHECFEGSLKKWETDGKMVWENTNPNTD